MAITTITLTDPVTGVSVPIKPRDGVAFQGFSFDPTVRAVEEDRVGGHGSVDTTTSLSSGAVTLNLRLYASTRAFLDDIARLLTPAKRPVLVVTDDEWDQPRQVAVRFDSAIKAITTGVGRMRDVSYSWKAPAGVWQAAQLTEILAPAMLPAAGGLQVAVSGLAVTVAGLASVAGALSGTPVIVNGGTIESQWQGKLYGPCTGPKIANDLAGLALEFTDSLILTAGQYVALDSANRTALLNSAPDSSVLGFLKFGTSDWWVMQPGINPIRYYPTSAGSGAVADITFQPGWMP